MSILFLVVGAALLIVTVFLPVVCVFIPVGFQIVGGCASLWEFSPLYSSAIILLIVGAAGSAIWRQDDELSGVLLTTGLFLALVSATGVVLLWTATALAHPYSLGAIAAAAGAFVVAAFLAKRPGQPVGIRCHLRAALLYVTIIGLVLGTLVAGLE
jgi:hypothetical protein